MNNTTHKAVRAFELKGSMFTLTVIHLLDTNLDAIATQLEDHIRQTPNLFSNMPVVIDLKKISQEDNAVDILGIQECLCKHGLVPIAIRHGNTAENAAAHAIQLAVLPPDTSKRKVAKTDPKGKAFSDGFDTQHPQNLLISTPVRSGQQIYARNANLIILSSVSHGAELLSDGHIHVYGSLRGRALAGVKGDQSARIFCHQLEAELVSIAGYYKLRDDLPSHPGENIVQIYLDEKVIHVEAIQQSF